MPAWYPLQLDPWQLSLKYLNSATEFPSDLVAQLVRAWQAICQVAGSSASLSYCIFSLSFFLIFTSHLSFSMTLTRLRSDCHCMQTIWKVDANHEEDACKITWECIGLEDLPCFWEWNPISGLYPAQPRPITLNVDVESTKPYPHV